MERLKIERLTVTVELPDVMYCWLIAHATRYGLSRNEVVRRAITRYLFELKRLDRKRPKVKTKVKPVKKPRKR